MLPQQAKINGDAAGALYNGLPPARSEPQSSDGGLQPGAESNCRHCRSNAE